ncbi:MAG: hypothetical protein BWX70_01688 [Verrucomicrobia bacterium ADurb.Bin070]|nr:MAG: hypothetical protein BWX70_01688 [Verrucomicrobia bacterium ADurb.Bin070]
MLGGLPRVEQIAAPHHLIHGAEAQLRHDTTEIFGDETHEVDHILRLAGKLFAEPRILRGDALRAGVEVADAHHDAAHRDERRGGEPELFGAQQTGDRHIAAAHQLAVTLQSYAVAQFVDEQRLLRLGQPQLPRQPRMLDRRHRRRAGSSVPPADQDQIGLAFRHARGNRPHPGLRHELDADARVGIGVLQVVDQLRQIFDRVDVMMRRR